MDLMNVRPDRGDFGAKRRPPRAVVACQMCRIRKSKCDQGQPSCSSCLEHHLDCHYPLKKDRRTGKSKTSRGSVKRLTTAPSTSSPQNANLYRDLVPAQNSVLLETNRESIRTAAFDNVTDSTNNNERQNQNQSVASDFPQEIRENGESRESHGDETLSGLTTVNPYTRGTEFFGPSSNNVFLLALMSKSQARKGSLDYPAFGMGNENGPNDQQSPKKPDSESLVSLLHNEDYPMVSRPPTPDQHPADPEAKDDAIPPESISIHLGNGKSLPTPTSAACALQSVSTRTISRPSMMNGQMSETGKTLSRIRKVMLERECIHRYFQYTHQSIPFIDKPAFLQRCEAEVWSILAQDSENREQRRRAQRHRSDFLSLFNAVCALGAITAEDEPLFSSFVRNVTETRTGSHQPKFARISPPMRIARVYFDRVKLNLGDIFEYSCLESVQALFLMSVFCQQVLRPHSCYMYNSMAARAAISIGMTDGDNCDRASDNSRTWWCIYNHEIEICCSSGREPFLRPASCYQIPSSDPDTDSVDTQPSTIIYTMVPLTEILREIFEAFYATRSKRLRSVLTSSFDIRLHQWKECLPPCLRFEDSRPIQGWAIDQKMILKLRFHNAQILLHRPFLPLVQLSDPDNVHRKHLDVCVDAARNTLMLLHISYTHRPYLQNWWYHITCILYASTTIAYVLFLDINDTTRQELLKDVEISLALLRYMDTVSVAQKCMRLIENVVEMSHPSAMDRLPPRGLLATDGEAASRAQSRLEPMNQNEYEVSDDVSTHQPESLTGHASNLSTQQPPGRLERDLLLPFDSKGLDCLIDADILKLLSEDSPVSFAGNFETQDFLACDDYIFQDGLGWDV